MDREREGVGLYLKFEAVLLSPYSMFYWRNKEKTLAVSLI